MGTGGRNSRPRGQTLTRIKPLLNSNELVLSGFPSRLLLCMYSNYYPTTREVISTQFSDYFPFHAAVWR